MLEFDDKPIAHRVDIRLENRGNFKGRLTEAETGKPIIGGQLYLDNGVVLTTDKDGRFTIGGLKRTQHQALTVAPGRLRQRVLFDTTASAETELDIPVALGAKIIGRVTDKDGKPIRGAWVDGSASGANLSLRGGVVYCGVDGKYEYDGAVPPGQP